jgi:hypothetical protein
MTACKVVVSFDATRGEWLTRVLSPHGYHVARVIADGPSDAALQALHLSGLATLVTSIEVIEAKENVG